MAQDASPLGAGTRNPALGTRNFEVIPAIDIRGGQCVRLFQGDYGNETVYGEPVAMARHWQSLGASRLHVVDLDGAREKRPVNRDLMLAICRAVDIPVEVAGGIRDLDTVRMWVESGADRVQLGSAAVADPGFVREAVQAFAGHIAVSIDCRDGEVMTNGWLEGSGIRVLDLARTMAAAGVARVMVTDIARDGALVGPNLGLYRDLVAALTIPVIASGGVGSYDDLEVLAHSGCEGVVVGKALYEGTVSLPEALARLTILSRRDTERRTRNPALPC